MPRPPGLTATATLATLRPLSSRVPCTTLPCRFVFRLEELTAVNLSKAAHVRASAAITFVGPGGGVQLCGFTNRNRAFRALQTHLAARVPRLPLI